MKTDKVFVVVWRRGADDRNSVCDDPESVIDFVSDLEKNESVKSIWQFDEHGNSLELTVVFEKGRLSLEVLPKAATS